MSSGEVGRGRVHGETLVVALARARVRIVTHERTQRCLLCFLEFQHEKQLAWNQLPSALLEDFQSQPFFHEDHAGLLRSWLRFLYRSHDDLLLPMHEDIRTFRSSIPSSRSDSRSGSAAFSRPAAGPACGAPRPGPFSEKPPRPLHLEFAKPIHRKALRAYDRKKPEPRSVLAHDKPVLADGEPWVVPGGQVDHA